MRKILLALVGLWAGTLCAQVRILTFHYNRPHFVEWQVEALRRNLLDDYELIVFNDAPDEEMAKKIEAVCERYALRCVRFEQEWHELDPLNEWIHWTVHDPETNRFFCFPLKEGRPERKAIVQQCSVRHCHVIQFALDHFGYEHDDILVILDADMFLLKPLSIRELLAHCPWVAIDSEFGDKHYPWVPFVAMDFKKLPDIREIQFHVDVIDGVLCDSGSHAYHYLQEHPEISYQLYPRCPGECGVEFYMGGQWVHHLGGSSLIPNEQKEGFIRSLLPF